MSRRTELDRENVSGYIINLIRDGLSEMEFVPEIKENTPLADLQMDSLKLVETIFNVENHFSIQVDEDLLAELKTVNDIISAVMTAASREVA